MMIYFTTDAAKRKLFFCAGIFSMFSSNAVCSQVAERQSAPYQIVASIPGGDADGLWDYATIDGDARRLYLAQDGVTVLDLDTGKVTPHFVTGKLFQGLMPTHHVLPVNGGKALAVTDVATNSVDFFDQHTALGVWNFSVGRSLIQ